MTPSERITYILTIMTALGVMGAALLQKRRLTVILTAVLVLCAAAFFVVTERSGI